MKRFVLFLACIGCWHCAFAQLPGIAFSHYTIEDGLPNDNITTLAQDREGFLWVGTRDGLARFDGRRFEVFRHADSLPHSIPHNHITGLSLDPQGRIWVSTETGVCWYDAAARAFRKIPLYKPGSRELHRGFVNGLVTDRDGFGWLAADSFVARINLATFETTHFPFPEGYLLGISGIYQDSRRRFWVNMAGRTMQFFPETGHYKYYMGREDGTPSTSMIAEGPDGRIWASTWGQGFYVLNEKTDRFDNFEDRSAISLLFLFDDLPDYGPLIWVAGGLHGIYVLTLRDTVAHEFRRQPEEPYSHNGTRVNVMFRDTAAGILWFGTEGGLEKYDPNDLRCSRAYLPEAEKLGQFIAFTEVIRDPADPDRYWIGVWGAGLYEWRRSAHQFRRFGVGMGLHNHEPFDMVLSRRGTIWLAQPGGVEEFDPKTGRSRRFIGPSYLKTPKINHKILALEESADGNIWIGANYEGLFRLDPRGDGVQTIELPGILDRAKSRRVNSLAKDKQSRIYIGTDDGVYRCNPAETRATLLWRKPDGQLSCGDMTFDSLGRLWVASHIGAYCLDQNGALVDSLHIDKQVIYYLTTDFYGDLWVGAGNGLYRYDPAGRKIKNVFGKKDGLLATTIENLVATLPTGEIFVGHMYSFNIFDPRRIPRSTFPPRVVLAGLKVGNKEVALGPWQTLVLRPGDNVVSFDFSVLNFTQSEKTTLTYRLLGFQENWTQTLPGVPITYTNLDGGEYVLQVKAFTGDGVESAWPYELRLRVFPPFYKTTWFRLLLALALVGLVTFAFWYREQERRRLDRIRRRIARDLHDDMGSTLSSIRFFSEVAQTRLPDDESAGVRPLLQRIAGSAATLSDAVRDIVWAIGGKNDRLDDLVTRMREFGLKVCEAKGIVFHTDLPGELPERPLRPDQLRNFYLVFKEAVNNAAKYAGCSAITLRLRLRRGFLTLEIDDDGQGFDPEKVDAVLGNSGNGLPNLRQRAAEINGKLTVDTAPGQGTRVVLTAPLT